MRRIIFHPAVRDELDEAARFYDERQPGLGLRFILAAEEAIRRAQAHPLGFPLVEEGCRRCRLERFPYGIVYRATDESLHVLAVMHLRREPAYWLKRR